MMLFQALLRHQLNDMPFQQIFQNGNSRAEYSNILQLFMDNSPPDDYENTVCPFGIHSISQEAKQYLRMDAG